MAYYWIKGTLNGRTIKGTIEAQDDLYARIIALETYGINFEFSLGVIQYPAEPIIYQVSDMPALCGMPDVCQNTGRCPRNPVCTE